MSSVIVAAGPQRKSSRVAALFRGGSRLTITELARSTGISSRTIAELSYSSTIVAHP
jgi:hypothetical protein